MKIAIRADASERIGTGHVRRMISLGKAIALNKGTPVFIWRDLGLDIRPMLPSRSEEVMLPRPTSIETDTADHVRWGSVTQDQDADETLSAASLIGAELIIADHYSINATWHRQIRAFGYKLAVITDIPDDPVEADLAVDHNAGALAHKTNTRAGHIEKLLAGPAYALLDPSYLLADKAPLTSEVTSIGVFLGGTDPDNATEAVVKAIKTTGFMGQIEVVATSATANLQRLRRCAKDDPRITLTEDLPDLTSFYARHDLYVGGGGGALLERCCIGVASISLILAENQRYSIPPLAGLGATMEHDFVLNGPVGLAEKIARLSVDRDARHGMQARARSLVDGAGVKRVADCILSLAVE